MAHYFPYDVKLLAHAYSRSFLANQKARNAIVGAENLLKTDSRKLMFLIFLTRERFYILKAKELSKESQRRNIQNTALGWHAGIQKHQMANLCLHVYKYNTNSGDIFLIKIQ